MFCIGGSVGKYFSDIPLQNSSFSLLKFLTVILVEYIGLRRCVVLLISPCILQVIGSAVLECVYCSARHAVRGVRARKSSDSSREMRSVLRNVIPRCAPHHKLRQQQQTQQTQNRILHTIIIAIW